MEHAIALIPVNDLNKLGVAAILSTPRFTSESIKPGQCKETLVRMDVTPDHKHREHELEAALTETRVDLAAGRVVEESPEAHLARLGSLPAV